MPSIALTTETFDARIQSPGITLVDFWAPWCGPCRAFGPVFEAASGRHPDLTWAKVNSDEAPAVAGRLGIEAIPTLMVYRDGVLVYAKPGALNASALEDVVKRVRSLDMADVRRRLAAARPTPAA